MDEIEKILAIFDLYTHEKAAKYYHFAVRPRLIEAKRKARTECRSG